MLNNYQYFLVLAEELNISNAAKRLYISHQCLSKYIKNLEEECGLPLFERKPKFALTHAGKILQSSFREIDGNLGNLRAQLEDVKQSNVGEIRFGITEGRYPILVPRLLKEFAKIYPKIKLSVYSRDSLTMQEMIFSNELDLFMSGVYHLTSPLLKYDTVLTEHMFLVISDNMLKQYFPDEFPNCKKTFSEGVDLARFQSVPFVLNLKKFNTRVIIDKWQMRRGITLNCINEITQPNIQHLLSLEDYAASFCLTMYLPDIRLLNQMHPEKAHLNVFPIKDVDDVSPLAVIYHKNKIFPQYTKRLIALIRHLCDPYT